jgi:hypothetical protein
MAHSGIEAVIELAIKTARRRAPSGDIAAGLVAALRRMRAAVDEESPARASQLDATVRDVLIAANLGRREVPAPVTLPEPGQAGGFASVVLEDAALTCLALNAHTEDNSALHAAICCFAARLVGELGGAPAIGAVLDRIHAGASDGCETTAIPVSASLH